MLPLLLLRLLLFLSTPGASAEDEQPCESHADCMQYRRGLYCTKNRECGACEDDGEQPCTMWGDSIDKSCAVCGTAGESAQHPSEPSTSSGGGGGGRKKTGGRRAGRKVRNPSSGSMPSGGSIEEPFVAVPAAFTAEEVARIRREAAGVPAVHSNAGEHAHGSNHAMAIPSSVLRHLNLKCNNHNNDVYT
jgi:hypothetical protein